MNFGDPTSEEESHRIIDAALEAGVNFIDTANVYNAGRSEEIVGRALAKNGRRDAVVRDQGLWGDRLYETIRGPAASTLRVPVKTRCAGCRQTISTSTRCIDLLLRSLKTRRCARLTTWCAPGKCAISACSTYPAWLVMESLAISEKLHSGTLRLRTATI